MTVTMVAVIQCMLTCLFFNIFNVFCICEPSSSKASGTGEVHADADDKYEQVPIRVNYIRGKITTRWDKESEKN